MSAIIPQTVLALKGFSLVLENSAHCAMCILCITAYGGTLWWDLMELASNGGNSDNHIDYRARFETESEPRLILIRRLLNLTAVHTVHTPAMHCCALLCISFLNPLCISF